jgi:uncharacterized protein
MTVTLNPACPLCGLRFASRPLLDLHVREDHRDPDRTPEPDDNSSGDGRRTPSRRGVREGEGAAMRTIHFSLPVRDLQTSRAFFADLGFTFSPERSGCETACMTVAGNVFVTLAAAEWFRGRIDADVSPEAGRGGFVISLSAGSEQEVDDIVAKAISAGAKPAPIMEDRPVYSGSFQDLDGHIWQLTCPPQAPSR